MLAHLDSMTLKLAIYFILPAAIIYVLVSLSAPVLTFAAQTFVKRDVSHDTASSLMAYSILPSVGLATFVYWLTGNPWATLTTAFSASFLIGAVAFGNGIKDFSRTGTKNVAPIGFQKGLLLSFIVTLGMLVLALLGTLAYWLAT